MKKLPLILFILFILTNINTHVHGQAGTNDPTFNSGDLGFNYGIGFNNKVSAIALQPDGKIIAAGLFSTFQGAAYPGIIRLNADGTADNTFNPPAGPGFGNAPVNAIAIQADGKIIAAGTFTGFNNNLLYSRIIRFNANGSIDNTYSTGTAFSSAVFTVALQPDGKLIAGGFFTSFNGTIQNRIARLNVNGTLDNTFAIGSGFSSTVNSVVLQPNGKILVSGDFTSFNVTGGLNRVARLNINGSIDNSFIPSGSGFNASVLCLSLQPDGNIIAGGIFTNFNGTGRNRIARITSTGGLDSTFNPGTAFNDSVCSLALQSDGKIIAAGGFNSFGGVVKNFIIRLTAGGIADASYITGIGFNNTVNSILLQPDNMLLAAGNYTDYNNTLAKRIARITTDGRYDQTFNLQTGSDATVNPIAIQPNGKIIIGGSFKYFNGASRSRIARLNTDGTLDTTFNPGTGFNGDLWTITLQPDGKIVASGTFTTFNGSLRFNVARLNINGSLDTSFSMGTGFNSSVFGCDIQPDGKLIFCGDFTSYNGFACSRIVRVNANGSPDVTFNTGTGFNGSMADVLVQPDGKILACGSFTAFNGISRGMIARLNSNGSIDATFNPGTGFNSTVLEMALQPNGKIIACGNFSSYNGTVCNRIVRINVNGTLDLTFNTGTGFIGSVNGLAIQPDGKIITGGSFSSINGISRTNIARLNSNGTPDVTFNPGTGFNAPGGTASLVWQCVLQSDGKVVVSGTFTSIDGTGRNRIARLFAYSSPLPVELVSFNAVGNNQNDVICTWVTATETNNDFFTVEKSKDGIHFEAFGKVSGGGNSNKMIAYNYPDQKPYSGISYYRLKQTDFDGQFTYSKIVAVNLHSNDNFMVYPSVTYDNLYVSPGTNSNYTVISILDSRGSLVKNISGISNESTTGINLGDMIRGIYYISIKTEGVTEVHKIMKM